MREPLDRFEGAVDDRSIERDDDAGHRARSERHVDEMPRCDLDVRGHCVRERASGAAQTGEDRDLSSTSGHRS